MPRDASLNTHSPFRKQTKISDLVQIAPEDFSKHSIVAIEDNINAKYSNKVRNLSPECPHVPAHPLTVCFTGHPENRAMYMSVRHSLVFRRIDRSWNGLSQREWYGYLLATCPRRLTDLCSRVSNGSVSSIQGRSHAWQNTELDPGRY